MTLPLTPEELKQYNNVPTTPLSQKLGDTINELVAGSAYQVEDMAARNALTPSDKEVVRVKSTGELFVYDAANTVWRNVPNSSTRPDFFLYDDSGTTVVAVHVTPAGSDVDGEGTQTNPFRTVSRALDSVPNGYKCYVIVAVAGGNYPDIVWAFPTTGGAGTNDTSGGTFSSPSISIVGQSPYTDGEVINLSGGALTANNVPHPSGLGNYACQSDFNFPAYTTPINPADPAGQHLLYGPPTAVQGIYTPGFGGTKVVYSADNTTGVTRLVNKAGSNLFQTGDYYLINRDQLPTFDGLYEIRHEGEAFYSTATIYNCKIRTFLFGIDLEVRSANVSFTGCFVSSAGMVINSNSAADSLTNCIIAPITPGTRTNYVGALRGGSTECYFKDTTVNATTGQYFNFGGVYESTASQVKLVTGTDSTSTSHGAGPSVGISYFGGCDFIGPGIAMQLVNTSVRASAGSGNFTFDNVTNPLILTSGSFWGHLNVTAIGTCTAPVIVGTKSMTGNGNVTNQTGPGIAGWTVSNTANPGQEVQVGANPAPPVGFAALPQTDLALGNTSIGAIAK
jgi:hypothetical protein